MAEYVRDTFVSELVANKNYIDENYEDALKETFAKMDEMMQTPEGHKKLNSYTAKEPTDGEDFVGYADAEAEGNIALYCGCTS